MSIIPVRSFLPERKQKIEFYFSISCSILCKNRFFIPKNSPKYHQILTLTTKLSLKNWAIF